MPHSSGRHWKRHVTAPSRWPCVWPPKSGAFLSCFAFGGSAGVLGFSRILSRLLTLEGWRWSRCDEVREGSVCFVDEKKCVDGEDGRPCLEFVDVAIFVVPPAGQQRYHTASMSTASCPCGPQSSTLSGSCLAHICNASPLSSSAGTFADGIRENEGGHETRKPSKNSSGLANMRITHRIETNCDTRDPLKKKLFTFTQPTGRL